MSPCPYPLPLARCTETWASQESPEARVSLESLVSLACPDVQGQRDVLALWVGWADLVPPVLPVSLVMVDLLDSLDPLESKVSPVPRDVPELQVASAAATVSATPW